MEMTPDEEKREKIIFELTVDADGYPPVAAESLWAVSLGEGLFRVDNVPFFVRGIAFKDIIRASQSDSRWRFVELFKPGGHGVIRVVVFDESKVPELRKEFKDAGCDSEVSHVSKLFALDVPPEVNWKSLANRLDELSATGVIEYEEGVVPPASAKSGAWWKKWIWRFDERCVV